MTSSPRARSKQSSMHSRNFRMLGSSTGIGPRYSRTAARQLRARVGPLNTAGTVWRIKKVADISFIRHLALTQRQSDILFPRPIIFVLGSEIRIGQLAGIASTCRLLT